MDTQQRMISATNDGITVATTTGTEADAQAAVGLEAPIPPEASTPAAPLSPSDAMEPSSAAAADGSSPSAVDAAAPAETPTTPPEATAEPKKDRYQSRIDRLTWERVQAEEAAQAARAEAAALRAQLEARATAIEAEPTVEQFDTYEGYIKAQARWEAQQASTAVLKQAQEQIAALQARVEAEQAARARAEVAATFADRVDALRSEIPDIDAIINQDIDISLPMRDLIVRHPQGARMAVWLGQHPDECQRMAALPPEEALVEMGVVLAQVDRAPSGSRPSVAPRTSAPPPIRPVGGSATAATVPLDQADFPTYKKIRDQQEQEWRRSRL